MISSDDREAWLAARRELVTASDVAAMLGESTHKTREQLRMEKAGLAEEWQGDESTEIGAAMESTILEIAADRFKWHLRPCGVLMTDGLLGATPDAFLDSPWGPSVCQVKFTSAQPPEACKPRKDGSPSTAAYANGAPIYHQIQIQAELAVTGLDHGVLLVLHTQPGFRLRAYHVPRHSGVIARIRAEVPVFWQEVKALREGRLS